jgi:hypothetical protein
MLSDLAQTEAANRRLVPGHRCSEPFVNFRQQIVVGIEHAVRIGSLQKAIRNERRAAALQTAAKNKRTPSGVRHGKSFRRANRHLEILGTLSAQELGESAAPSQTEHPEKNETPPDS